MSYFSFLDNIVRISNSNYVPSIDDILRSRKATTGIQEYIFDISNITFRYILVFILNTFVKMYIPIYIYIVELAEYVLGLRSTYSRDTTYFSRIAGSFPYLINSK